MADSSILLSLLNGGKTEDDYLGQDLTYGAGASILKSQLPTARNNTEAIFGPILQGLIGGGLVGYGQGQARQSVYNDYRANPILDSLAETDPLASKYGSESAPLDWSSAQGKADLLSVMMEKEADKAAKQQTDKVNSTILGSLFKADPKRGAEFAKQTYGIDLGSVPNSESTNQTQIAMRGIPSNLQNAAAKEAAKIDTNDKALKALDSAYEKVKEIPTIKALIPRTDASISFDANKAAVLTAVTSMWKGVMSEPDRKGIEALFPDKLDTAEQLDMKKEALKAVVAAQQGESPLMATVRANLGKSVPNSTDNTKEDLTPPAGYEFTGRVVNGKHGIRKIQ